MGYFCSPREWKVVFVVFCIGLLAILCGGLFAIVWVINHVRIV